MKRRTKLILLVAVLGCLGGIGVVLSKIAQEAGVPFPGAVVVLDDASWRARYKEYDVDSGYLWATPDTILYKQKGAGGYQVVRRKVIPDKTVSAPETLPLVIGEGKHIDSLSPDGTMLCFSDSLRTHSALYTLVRTDGRGKPITITSLADHLFWSPDSQSLYRMVDLIPSPPIERIDAKTGAVSKTTIDTKEDFELATITPEGKLLGFFADSVSQSGQNAVQWKIKEVKGKQVVTTTYQKRFPPGQSLPFICPDGKRLLWDFLEVENSLLEKIQQKLFRKHIAHHGVSRYLVTDIDGNNERWIGAYPIEMQGVGELNPKWTPDGKGVHFIQNGKLMYLAVP